MVIAIIGILLLLAFLPKIFETISAITGKTADDKQAEVESEKERQDKGALVNTVEFVFGAQVTDQLSEVIDPKPKFETNIEKLEQAATEKFGTQIEFDANTTVTKQGIISSESPPSGDIASLLTTQELLAFQNKIQQRKETIVEVTRGEERFG